MKRTFKIEGLSDLDNALGQLPKATAKNVLARVALKRLAPMVEDMKERAPEDHGGLKASIIATTKRPKGGGSEPRRSTVEAFAGPGRHPKALQQEFGNEHHGPQPYVRPAWDNGSDALLDGIAEDLGDEISAAATRLARKQAKLIGG